MGKVKYRPIVIKLNETIEDTDVLFVLLFGMTRQAIANQCIMEISKKREVILNEKGII